MNTQRSVPATQRAQQPTTGRTSFVYTTVVAGVLIFATGIAYAFAG